MTADAGAAGAPRFDVVLRGYDRRQVDEHVARLQRIVSRMRADLDGARSQPFPSVSSPSSGFPAPGQQGPSDGRPRPTPRPRPGLPRTPDESPDMIGSFTDRMQSILQAAEEEAAEIRNQAHIAARADADAVRSDVADLLRQRDEVLAELTRMRSQLEGLLSSPTTRIAVPVRPAAAPSPRPTPGPGRTSAQTPADAPASAGPTSAGDAHAPGAGQDGVDRPGPAPKPSPTVALAPNGSGHGSESDLPNSSTAAESTSMDSTAATGTTEAPGMAVEAGRTEPPSKPAAHRLPTGAYPAVTAKPASMRPRSEPDPEPGELFRPLSDTRSTAPPTVRHDPPDDTPAGDVEATVKVGAVRPASADDTVVTPAVEPAESQDASAPEGERPESGGNGSGTVNRPASSSRSG